MNLDQFFRESVLRICGSLEIEKAMASLLEYMAPHLPCDNLFLQVYENNLEVMRTISRANIIDGQSYSYQEEHIITTLPEEIRKGFLNLEPRLYTRLFEVVIINDSSRSLMSTTMLKSHNLENRAILLMNLLLKGKGEALELGDVKNVHQMMKDGQGLGSLVLTAPEGQVFKKKHARLFGLLREPVAIAMANALHHKEVCRFKEMLEEKNRDLLESMRKNPSEIIGAKAGLSGVMNMIQRVARRNSPVLFLGETGVGKDLLAEQIHRLSDRKDNPFIAVNCGAIPANLIDSELFGFVKGAFTGAVKTKKGYFQRGEGGTVFLDEVGELPLDAQIRLLRVIQNGVITPVGGEKDITLDIRIIAATHRNLKDMVQAGTFREDLWYRITVFPIKVPPLRERLEDLPLLVDYFIAKKSRELKLSRIPSLGPDSIEDLKNYSWPGNIRELENILERALILYTEGPLNLSPFLRSSGNEETEKPVPLITLDEVMKQHIEAILVFTKGRVHGAKGAAAILGINASTLRHKMDRLNISYGKSKKIIAGSSDS